MTEIKWIAVDWGTSNCRAWAIDHRDQIVAHMNSDKGMGQLKSSDYEAALLELVGEHLSDHSKTEIVICGMAGAQSGWIEAPYELTPCVAPNLAKSIAAPTTDGRLSVRIIPGVAQASPPDVMRGEETQIAGFFLKDPKFDGVLCLPGTHTKWVHLSAGEIVSFRTFMTGDLFAMLADRSVLNAAVSGGSWDDQSFLKALDETISKPELISSRLFGLRAAHLLDGPNVDQRYSELSGHLIGAELAGAKPYWLGQRVAVLGSPTLIRAYGAALRHVGVDPEPTDAAELTLLGLTSAYHGK